MRLDGPEVSAFIVRLFRDCGNGGRVLGIVIRRHVFVARPFPYLEFAWDDWRKWGGKHVQVTIPGLSVRWQPRTFGLMWSDGVPFDAVREET